MVSSTALDAEGTTSTPGGGTGTDRSRSSSAPARVAVNLGNARFAPWRDDELIGMMAAAASIASDTCERLAFTRRQTAAGAEKTGTE